MTIQWWCLSLPPASPLPAGALAMRGAAAPVAVAGSFLSTFRCSSEVSSASAVGLSCPHLVPPLPDVSPRCPVGPLCGSGAVLLPLPDAPSSLPLSSDVRPRFLGQCRGAAMPTIPFAHTVVVLLWMLPSSLRCSPEASSASTVGLPCPRPSSRRLSLCALSSVLVLYSPSPSPPLSPSVLCASAFARPACRRAVATT